MPTAMAPSPAPMVIVAGAIIGTVIGPIIMTPVVGAIIIGAVVMAPVIGTVMIAVIGTPMAAMADSLD